MSIVPKVGATFASVTGTVSEVVAVPLKHSVQYVECISKSYRFLCNKCGKRFRKLITSDLQNQAAVDNLEDTLN